MRLRTHTFFATVVCGALLAVLALIAFSLFNAGIDLRAGHHGDVDPASAAMVGFGAFGFFHSIAIIFFTDDPTAAKGRRFEPRIPDSFTGFIRKAGYKVFSVGPIFAAFTAAAVFIWQAIAAVPGTPETVWGDYLASPLPAIVVFLACWSAANIGFAIAACAEAFHRTRSGLVATILVAMFIVGLGITAGFAFLPSRPTSLALLVTVIAFPLSLLAMTGALVWAISRVARWEAPRPASALWPESRAQHLGSNRPGAPGAPGTSYPGGPPFDVLEPDETVLTYFKSERTPEPQLLIATNQRFVRASILGTDRTFILEQAGPGQLAGARSERVGRDLMTTAHFHDHPVMRVVGGDPRQSRAFAVAVTRLTRSGQLRR